jgi:hypothetical protein
MSCFTTTLPLLTQHAASSSADHARQHGIRPSLLAKLKLIAMDETEQVLEPPRIEGSRAELDYNRDDLNFGTDAAETLASAVSAPIREDFPAAAEDPAGEVMVLAHMLTEPMTEL